MAQNYGPGSPYPTTETGKRMAAAGIPIFAGGQDPAVYMQSGESAVVGRPATFTGAPGSEAGMTPEMLAKLRASMAGVPMGPDYEFMPAPGTGSESAPPVMSETMPAGGGYPPDMRPPIAPPMGGGGVGQGGVGTPQFGPPMQPPVSEVGPPMQPPVSEVGPPMAPPVLPPVGPPMQPPVAPPVLPPVTPKPVAKPQPRGLPNPRRGFGGPRQVPNVNKLKRQYGKMYGLPPGALGGMRGGQVANPFGGSSYPKPRGPRKSVAGPRRVAL